MPWYWTFYIYRFMIFMLFLWCFLTLFMSCSRVYLLFRNFILEKSNFFLKIYIFNVTVKHVWIFHVYYINILHYICNTLYNIQQSPTGKVTEIVDKKVCKYWALHFMSDKPVNLRSVHSFVLGVGMYKYPATYGLVKCFICSVSIWWV